MNWKMLIGGTLVDSANGGVIENFNPYSGELIGSVPMATKDDVDRAVANAVEGQKEWYTLRLDERETILNRFLALLQEHSEELAQLLCSEGGKTISECRGEIKSVPMIFRAYMNAAAMLNGQVLSHNVEARNTSDAIMTVYEPLGVCVCIAPFNYPISTMTNKIAPALCAGNSVIVKPSSDTPMSTLLYGKLMLEAGMPPNAIQVITGNGADIGKWITENRNVAAVSLTGSTEVGVALHRGASEHLQRILLELGGNDPLIVFEDCDMEKAVEEAINGRIYNAGQICSASKRFLVQESIYEEFQKRLVEKLGALKFGDPTDPTVISSCCLINQQAAKRVEAEIMHAIEQGAELIYGGQRTGSLIEPTVLVNVMPGTGIAQDEEVFGPVFPIIPFHDFDEAMSIANDTKYGLSAGIMTNDISKGMRAALCIRAGTCVINGTGDYRTSYHGFGGMKMSGIGREGASQTLKEYSEVKTLVIRSVFS